MTGKIARTSMLVASCVGILLGAAALLWTPVAWGQGAFSGLQVEVRSMDRSLEGMRKGVLTKAQDGTVWIDGRAYALAFDALVENRTGRRLQVRGLRLDDVQFSVEYWLDGNQITQTVINFPE